jgi:DNA-binding NtrC family response regulator
MIVGNSFQIRELKRTIDKIRKSTGNVLITGESGTGKELVARELRGTLADGSPAPFVSVDSATIQSSMAESLLFGHEKGAFTGADRAKSGLFEEAHGGIIYFDEIENMPIEIQAKLLRVIQEKEVMRLGASKATPLSFRVVSATNQPLDQWVTQGKFKADLFQRLNVLPISLPPLRDRSEDIPLLVEHFLKQSGRKLNFSIKTVETMKTYSWPGNVRELSNLVTYLTAMSDSDFILPTDLPAKIRGQDIQNDFKAFQQENRSFYDTIRTFEKELLTREFARHRGVISRMAASLGMDRSHLYQKLKEYQVHRPKVLSIAN